MYCTECGAKLLENAYFCGECGQIQFKRVVQDAKAKKEDAIAALIDVTKNKLYYTAFRFLKDDAAAEDILQESYIQSFQSLDSLQDENKFVSWMTTIVINRCKSYLSIKKNTEFTDFSSLDTEKENYSFEQDIQEDRLEFVPDKNFNYEQLKQGLDQVLDELPDNQRMAILLYYLDEFKVKEVADIMNVSQGTIKSLLNYGRKAIKTKIEELRKQNKSFYSIVPIPFLVWMLKEEVKAQSITPQLVQNVMKGIGTSGVVSSTGAATKGMLSIGGKAISAKVIAGLTALVIDVGSIGGYTLSQTVFKGTGRSDEKASAQEKKDDIAAYDSLIDEYYARIASGVLPSEEYDTILSEFELSMKEMIMQGKTTEDITEVFQISAEERLSNCGYTFVDLNNDGQSELLIGSIESGKEYGNFSQLFTLDKQHNPVVVTAETYNIFDKVMESESVQSFGNYNYYLGKDKKVYYAGWTSRYDKIHVAGQYQFSFNGEKLVCEEAYEMGDNNYKIDMDTKNVTEVSLDEANTIYKNKIEKDFMPIEFTPFSDILDKRNKEIQKNGFSLKYLDAKIQIPEIFKYQVEGPYTQLYGSNYVTLFVTSEENNPYEGFEGRLTVYCWTPELFPGTKPHSPEESKRTMSERKKDPLEKDTEFFGTEDKYITLSSYGENGDEYFPNFGIGFIDLSKQDCEYSISIEFYQRSGYSNTFTKEEYDQLYSMVVDMIKSCTFLAN